MAKHPIKFKGKFTVLPRGTGQDVMMSHVLNTFNQGKRIELPEPRFFSFKAEELLQADIKPGMAIIAKVSGIVKSIDDEGNVMVNIVMVNDQASSHEGSSHEEVRVVTQESHSP